MPPSKVVHSYQMNADENASLLSSLENGSNNRRKGGTRRAAARPRQPPQRRSSAVTLTPMLTVQHSLQLLAVAAVLVAVSVMGGLWWEKYRPTVPKPKYSHAQFFGFQIYTGGAPAFLNDPQDNSTSNRVPNPECMGMHSYGQVVLDVDPVLLCYLGHKDPLKDVDHRLGIMRDAVEAAYQQASKQPDTLKIFVAPEFYWRGRSQGAYELVSLDRVFSETCKGAICKILRGLEDIVEDRRFQDWFFVFGTIIAAQHLPSERDYQHLFYNFAPMYKGYDPSSDRIDTRRPLGKRFLLPKRYVSDSDFLRQPNIDKDLDLKRGWAELLGVDNDPNTTDNPFYTPRKRYDDHLFDEYKQAMTDDAGYVMIEYDWLILDGVTMTTEICFDHQKKTALHTYLGDMIKGRPTRIPSASDERGLEYVPIPTHQAQLGVVSSAGMTIVADSMALMENGTLFLQDGLSDKDSYQYIDYDMWNTCDQGIQFEGGTEAVSRRSIVSNTDVNFLYQVLVPSQKLPVFQEDAWKAKLKNTFTTEQYPPHIVVYPPVAIVQPQMHS